MAKKIKWDKRAMTELRSVVEYIRNDSDQNAEKVKKELLSQIYSLKDSPERYPIDKYKIANSGMFRAFELHHFRVSYAVTEKEIVIARIRHTSMEPLEY